MSPMISSMSSASRLCYISNSVECIVAACFWLPSSSHSFILQCHFTTLLSLHTRPTKQISHNQFQLQCGSHTDPSLMLETQLMYNRGFQHAWCGRRKKRVQFPESATDFLDSEQGWSTEKSCYYIMELCWLPIRATRDILLTTFDFVPYILNGDCKMSLKLTEHWHHFKEGEH